MSKLLVGLALLTIVFMVTPVLAIEGEGSVPVGAQPGDQAALLCIKDRNLNIGTADTDEPGINPFDYRSGLYAFTGEQLEYIVVVRDFNGADDIGFLYGFVNAGNQVLATEIPLTKVEDYSCNGLGELNPATDKAFTITFTVEPRWNGEKDVKLVVYNALNEPTIATHVERWFFNPALTIDVTTSDGNPITFSQLRPGDASRTVYSTNRLIVKNQGEGGMHVWTYIAGTDLYDPSGTAKCPTTNQLDINNMQYRGWIGTPWQGSEGWNVMNNKDSAAPCSLLARSCNVAGGPGVINAVPYDPSLPAGTDNILTNGNRLEVEFKLTYPLPCIGTFGGIGGGGTIYVFAKAI